MVSALGHRFKKTEILFGLFSVYVLLSYIAETWIFGDSSIVRVLLQLTLLHLGFGVVLMLSTVTIGKGLLGKIGLSVFVSYLFVLISDSVSSSSFTFSALRSIISFYILFISLIFFTTSILSHIKSAKKDVDHICIFLIPLFTIAVVWHITYGLSFQGKYTFRLHGWSNPNTIGQFSLLPLFWSHYVSLRYKRWNRSHKLLWWLSLTVLLLSISRGAILCFIVTYTCYYTFKFAGNLAYVISSRYKFAKRKVFYVVSTLAIFVLVVFLYDPSNISYLLRAEEIGSRLTLRTVEQRLIGWKHLWPYFTSNPLTGGAGWWNATNIVEATAAYGGVTSPHSLYVRLLSEVGILGTVAVLSLPGIVVILLLKKAALTHVKKYNFHSSTIVASFILGLFVRQLFEDSYLVGFGEMGSSIVIFAISVGIVEINIG